MVKQLLVAFILVFTWSCSNNQPHENAVIEVQNIDSLNLIPLPKSIEKGNGHFELNQDLHLVFPIELSNEGKYLNNLLTESCNSLPKVNIESKAKAPTIQLNITTESKTNAYSLKIKEDYIHIDGGSPEAVMHGIQTLRQLFIPAFHSQEKRDKWYLPSLTINDSPKFRHRGLLLDVCRHFFDKDVVLKYIDALAFYKMNVLHFHLTEDQGWRIPIEKYPLLNEISSWRLDSNGNKYGGFYTKDELIEIVNYASERHITVIPEVELPGHAQAALAAYPQFSCNGGPIEVANDWGVFKEIYCAGNDSTFTFLEDILTEVMEIFPSEYIHIGGDEAPKFRWEHCKKCQKRMKDEGLADEHELQSYFIKRIEGFLNENGRKLIGWDEILEGGVSPNSAVQFWRGTDEVNDLARHQDVILSPTSHCYLDYGLSSIDLKKIYSFDPIPADFELNNSISPTVHIMGGECNMWTEHVPDEANLDSKVFPRMIALAEILWSYPEERNFDNFYTRLQSHYPTLEAFGIQYGLETIGATINQSFSDTGVFILLDKNLDNLNLKYKWKNGIISSFSDYESPILLEESDELAVQAYKNEEPYGEPIKQAFVFHQALNKKATYATAWSQWYTGNAEKNLVDGKMGSLDFRDGNWQGFWGNNIDITLDLGEPKPIMSVGANFYQYANSWIFLPKKVVIEISEDGDIWTQLTPSINDEIDLSNKKRIKYMYAVTPYGVKLPEARYIRLQATSIGKVPAGHEAEGQDVWLFIDEIMVD